MSIYDRFKFRVWLEYAKLYYNLDSFYYDRLKNKYTFHFEDGHTKTIKEKDCAIEQCTGLKDKNGKLIYEGDILKHKSYKDSMGAVWGFLTKDQVSNVYHPVFWKNGHYYLDSCVLDYHVSTFVSDSEVIGNIHENPELLKESK